MLTQLLAQAWTIFQAFEKHCKLPAGGYASIRDVDALPVQHEDRMETFWLSETLKVGLRSTAALGPTY